MKRKLLIIIGIFSGLVCGCHTTTLPDTSKLYQKETAAKIFAAGNSAMQKGDFDEATQRFEVIESRYPFGEFAQRAQLNLIYTYYKQDDSASTLAASDQYLRLYPRGPSADYAYYMRGVAEFNLNHGFFERYFTADFAKRDLSGIKSSFADFNRVVRYFPNSKYAPDARQRMIYIRNTLARHIYEVGEFYYKDGAYVAAVNRANEVVKHYQGTPSVEKALVMMYNSYRRLGLDSDAAKIQKVINLNYPKLKI